MANVIDTMNSVNPHYTLGKYLRNRRIQQGLTQSDVAQKLGYGSPQFISNIERGISNVPVRSLKAIIDLYNVSPEEVLNILLEEKKQFLSAQLGLVGAPTNTAPQMTATHVS